MLMRLLCCAISDSSQRGDLPVSNFANQPGGISGDAQST